MKDIAYRRVKRRRWLEPGCRRLERVMLKRNAELSLRSHYSYMLFVTVAYLGLVRMGSRSRGLLLVT